MIRNLISNALKYTHTGKVLIGCRCRQGNLRIEIWDTGIGIPESELKAIFEEYHQVDNAAPPAKSGPRPGACPSSRVWANCLAIRSACARCTERARCSRSRSR
jgi:hypothetical protein